MFLILLFINSSTFFTFWILLEINTIIFILIIYLFNLKENFLSSESCFFYFLLQSITSLLIIWTFSIESFFNFGRFMTLIRDILLGISIAFKLRIYPFRFWFYEISKIIDSYSFVILITIQKIPLFLIRTLISSLFLNFLIIINLIVGSVFLIFRKNLKDLFIRSSIYNVFWFVLFIKFDYKLFIIFYLMYSIFILILAIIKIFKVNFYFKTLNQFLFIIVFFIFSVGLPPSGIFFIKYYFFLNFLIKTLNVLIFIILFRIVTVILGYLIFFYNSFFFKFYLYNNLFISFKKVLRVIFFSFSFILFI